MHGEPIRESYDQRVLVLAPEGRDAEVICDLLSRAELPGATCDSVECLCERMAEGAGTAIIARDALSPRARICVAAVLDAQPVWSDFPLLVFADERERLFRADDDEDLTALGNVVLLERPIHVSEVLSAVRTALRARARQYEARRALEARESFLAVLGHELRNPIAAIRGALEVSSARGVSTEATRCLEVVERQTCRLTRMVDELLDVARVSYGKVMLERCQLDLNAVVLGSVRAVEPSARAARVALELLPCDRPLLVWADRERVEQVLGNLLTNALKFTPRDGTVRVSVRAEPNGCASVRVLDTGVGIEPSMLGRVFEPFAQLEESRARAQGGLGIGLSLVKTLVQLHGGEVEARSQGAGCGSEFRVTLPLAREEGAALAEALATRARRPRVDRSHRVVLVEDDEDIRSMMREMLMLRGHDVVIGKDGPQGVACILEACPDVAFVDVGLPGFDGFEVARRVRRQGGAHVRLVAVTGYGRPEDRARAIAAGFDQQLTKPVRLEDLDAALSQLSAPSA